MNMNRTPPTNPDMERARILEERAALLAAIPDAERTVALRTLVCFTLGPTHYAADAIHILEVGSLSTCIPIPDTPPHVAGLINQRGRLLTVLDLRPIVGLPRADLPHPQLLIVRLDAARRVGVRVDTLEAIRDVPQNDLHSGADLLNTLPAETVSGVFNVEGVLTVVLDLPRLLLVPDWVVDDQSK